MRHLFAVAVAVLVAGMASAADADKKKLEETVDTLLKAYNEGDAKTFNAQYAKTMAAVATDQTFENIYKKQYMEKYGKFESKKAIDKETVATGDFPLLVYEAKFAKAEKVKVSVNFTKDGDAFKVMQVRFDPLQ